MRARTTLLASDGHVAERVQMTLMCVRDDAQDVQRVPGVRHPGKGRCAVGPHADCLEDGIEAVGEAGAAIADDDLADLAWSPKSMR
ncbi:hypothetical protein GCM10009574_100300 [Streptomyces asiaticus]|uniref:Uncharacterized protein n=2 Tax=Streptomyces rhizosphaericus TaxID=114699 RepID=A0ABN1SR18_9ACTN